MPKILQPEANYTFRSFFDLPNDPDEILAEFDYGYAQGRLALPKTTKSLPELSDLKAQIEATLPYVHIQVRRRNGRFWWLRCCCG